MTSTRTWIAGALLVAAVVAAYLALVPLLSSLGGGPEWPTAAQTVRATPQQIVLSTEPPVVAETLPAQTVTEPATTAEPATVDQTTVVGTKPKRIDAAKKDRGTSSTTTPSGDAGSGGGGGQTAPPADSGSGGAGADPPDAAPLGGGISSSGDDELLGQDGSDTSEISGSNGDG